jgi:hypothetical protein
LWAQEAMTMYDPRWDAITKLAPEFVSRAAGAAFLGYLQAQKQRLLGLRGHGGHGSPRPDLVEKYGYDTKFAMHMLRLGIQGVELLTRGSLALPMAHDDRRYLLSVREGAVDLQGVLTRAGELESNIVELMESGPLPEKPNTAPIERWMLNTYHEAWAEETQ